MQARLLRLGALSRQQRERRNEIEEAESRKAAEISQHNLAAAPNDTRCRVLMLGSGGGQLLKTFKISQQGRLGSEEIPAHRDWIQGTVFNAMEAYLKELILPKAEFSQANARAQTILAHCDSANEITPEIAAEFKVLWASVVVKHSVPLLFRTAP